jgi:hypothetical protein
MMSNVVRQQQLPVNLHWVYQAIRDAANVKTKEDINKFMRLEEQTLFTVMSGYMQKDLPEYTKELVAEWFERVSAQENVVAMFDAKENKTGVYYRINHAGGDRKPVNDTDSIAVKYAVYSRNGKLLESNEMFVDNLKKQREQISNNQMIPDSMRQNYLKQIDAEIENSVIRKLPLNRFMQKDVQEALKLVGNGGNITLWMDGVKALGYRASRIMPANEAVAINVELLDVKSVKPTPKPVTNKITIPSNGKEKVAPQSKAANRPAVMPVQKK